jgi:serine/threonine protein kinase
METVCGAWYPRWYHRRFNADADGRVVTTSLRAKRLAAGLPQRYAFRSLIGRGSAAYVVLADDIQKNERVAIKILRAEVTTLPGVKRFEREIEILRTLNHPNILPFLDHGSTADGSLYLVTPFVAGETLRMRLLREKRLSVQDALAIATDVANALDYAHARSLIHRDIKPANILLEDGRVIVGDFGISRAMSIEGYVPITLSGVSLGTPEYMSPEQIGADVELDARSDVYALGCVVYEMLTGKPPFSGRVALVFTRHRTELPKSIRALRPEIPATVEKAVLRALEKGRSARFGSAGEFVRALTSV